MTEVEIKNSCVSPPYGVLCQVRRSLRWIDPTHLEGLAFIHLMDDCAEWGKWQEKDATVMGSYVFATKSTPPYIKLSVKDIYRGIPSWLWWSTIPTLRITQTLAHETAHHLASTRRYILNRGECLNEEEKLANKYAERVLQGMMKRWHYKLGNWCIKDLAGWYFAFGLAAARNKKYRSASDRFYTTWLLDPENQDALDFYWSSKEKAETELKS